MLVEREKFVESLRELAPIQNLLPRIVACVDYRNFSSAPLITFLFLKTGWLRVCFGASNSIKTFPPKI
jgi:hypothetical protein